MALYPQPFFVCVLNISLCATVDIMSSSFSCFAILVLIDDPQGPPPATPGHRPGRQVSEGRSLKRKRDGDQHADPKLEDSNVPKLREAKLIDRGATT